MLPMREAGFDSHGPLDVIFIRGISWSNTHHVRKISRKRCNPKIQVAEDQNPRWILQKLGNIGENIYFIKNSVFENEHAYIVDL